MEIFNLNCRKYIEVEGGSTPLSLLQEGKVKLDFTPICCRINNKTEDLRFPLYGPKQVEFLPDSSESGRRVYVRALCFMLYKAASEMFPGSQLRIEHSIFRGYFCRLRGLKEGTPISLTEQQVKELEERMNKLADVELTF